LAETTLSAYSDVPGRPLCVFEGTVPIRSGH
jgi:hypothetical protein